MALRRSRGDEGFDEAHESIVYGNGYGLVKPHKSGDQGNHYGKMLAVVLVLGYVVSAYLSSSTRRYTDPRA